MKFDPEPRLWTLSQVREYLSDTLLLADTCCSPISRETAMQPYMNVFRIADTRSTDESFTRFVWSYVISRTEGLIADRMFFPNGVLQSHCRTSKE